MKRTLLGLTLIAGLGACVIPPQTQTQAQPLPWGPQPAQGQTYQTAAATEPADGGSCEAACEQIASCGLSTYDACTGACAGTSDEQLDAIAQASCDELAAAVGSAPASSQTTVAVETGSGGSGIPAGRWISTEWATVTNAAWTSADFYLSITLDGNGGFRGSWARYICLTGAYGIISCSLGPIEGDASGQLSADGTGVISLERLGRSGLAWTAKSANEIAIELPRDWQGDLVLFRSSIKR